MNINGMGGTNAVAWAQFVKAAHVARERNSGLNVESAARGVSAPQSSIDTNTVSFKRAADVYSSKPAASLPTKIYSPKPSPQVEMNLRTVGVNFDAYA